MTPSGRSVVETVKTARYDLEVQVSSDRGRPEFYLIEVSEASRTKHGPFLTALGAHSKAVKLKARAIEQADSLS